MSMAIECAIFDPNVVTMWWAVPATWHQKPPALASSRSEPGSPRLKVRVRRSPVSVVDVIERTREASGPGSEDTVARRPSLVPATRQ